MAYELKILAWGCVLALVHILAASHMRTRQFGIGWNTGPRDADPDKPAPIVGRLLRAQANYFETFPIVAVAILIDVAAGLTGSLTALGASLWLGARVIYLPLYAAGVPGLRSLVWLVSFAGLVLLLAPAVWATF
ncbi:MAG: MAPEG family protein [Sphingobium sp.]|nr:MAPEG family protein [Sphingobium sp.]